MKLFFSKFKFSNGLFYKKIDHAEVDVLKDGFDVSISPYFSYSGKYHITSVYRRESNRVTYVAIRVINEEETDPSMYVGEEYFISVYNDKRKIIIFDRGLNGIILKS